MVGGDSVMNNQSDEIRNAKREYHREWRKNNPDRVAKIQERFWHRKAAELRSREQVAAGNPGQQTGGE